MTIYNGIPCIETFCSVKEGENLDKTITHAIAEAETHAHQFVAQLVEAPDIYIIEKIDSQTLTMIYTGAFQLGCVYQAIHRITIVYYEERTLLP